MGELFVTEQKKDWIALYGNKSQSQQPKRDWIAQYDERHQESNQQPEGESFITKLPRNLTAGLLEGLRGIGNVPHAIAPNYFHHFKPTDFRKMVGLNEPATTADKLSEIGGQFLPAIIAPEAQLGRAGEAIQKIPKIGKFIKSAIGNAIYPSAYAATQSEDNSFKEAGKTAAETLPFTALMQGIASRNPYLRIAARTGLGGIGASTGFLGAKVLGLPTSAQLSGAAIGSLAGLIGRNPTREAQKQIAETLSGKNYEEKLKAAERLNIKYLTPAEAGESPFLGAMQGNIGKTEVGSQKLYEAGQGRLKSESESIDKLLNTVFKEEKHAPEVTRLYKEAGQKMVPEESITPFKENEIYKTAKSLAESKPAYKESLKDVPENSIAYQDIINRSLNDMIQSAIKSGNNNEARLMKKTQKEFLNELDTLSPEFSQARALAEREKARETIEKAFNTKEMIGTNLYRGLLGNKQKFDDLYHHLRNVPEAQSQLKDMRLIFKDLINPPTVRTAAGTTRAGMNQERNTKKAYAEMLKQLASFGKKDTAMVDLITNPNWKDELHKLSHLTNKEKKLIQTTNLLGKITASLNSENKKPLEIEVVGRKR